MKYTDRVNSINIMTVIVLILILKWKKEHKHILTSLLKE